jgi:signal transduction histidine kinase
VEGSGLGLSIAGWIAQAHQATLSVESQENAGSTFRIVFPLLADGAAKA